VRARVRERVQIMLAAGGQEPQPAANNMPLLGFHSCPHLR
jgi:hypothetical protein